jgi:hypothetical protein
MMDFHLQSQEQQHIHKNKENIGLYYRELPNIWRLFFYICHSYEFLYCQSIFSLFISG